MEVRLRRWLPVLLVVLALATAGWAAAGGTGLSGGELPPSPPDPLPPPSPGAATPASPSLPPEPRGLNNPDAQFPGWLGWLLTVLYLGLAAGVILLFLYVGVRWLLTERVIRREIVAQPASQPAGAGAEQVREAVRAGLAEIDAGEDPRRAVIACWLRLEQVAAAVGTARLAADTPADLVARLLAGHRVSDRALRRLADAYRWARYAPADVAEELVATAREALGEIDAQLTAGGRPDPERVAG